jgi:hypothetical protein
VGRLIAPPDVTSGSLALLRRRLPRLAGVLVLAIVGAIAIALLGMRAVAPSSVVLEESGVRVELTYTGGDRGEIVAVFRPLHAGFHLYGPDLPRDGIDGAGRPTLLELSPISGWSTTGAVRSEPATTLQTLPSFDRPFPVFPDGAAILRLPVVRDQTTQESSDLIVSVTYMACSSSGLCLAPVIEREINVPVRS